MKLLLLAAIFAVSSQALAAAEVVKPIEYDLFFMTSSGKKVLPAEATLGALKGEKFYKCQTVEATVNERGTISARNSKKKSN